MVDEQATPVAAAGDGVRSARGARNPDGVAGRKKEESKALTAPMRQRFLDALAATGCVEKAAAAAERPATHFYGFRRRNEVFRAEWKDALEAGYDAVEGMLLRYVLSRGEERPVEAGAVDATDGDAAAGSARRGFRHGIGEVTEGLPTWAHVAIALLNRHRASIEGTARVRAPGTSTREDASAMLRKRLDQLARSLKGAP